MWRRLFSVVGLLALFSSCTTLDPVAASRLRILEAALHGTDQHFRAAAVGLVDSGADSAFIVETLHNPHTVFLPNMLRINVSGFVKRADYSLNTTDRAVRSARSFYDENRSFLQSVEDSTGVPASVVTAILFVETKFGKVTGNHNVVSVYASLAGAADPVNIDSNKASYRSFVFSPDSLHLLDSMVEARARRKAVWAVDQLMALREIQDRLPGSIYTLNGSWAGAFGWSQFIPSSYRSWAVDGNHDGKIDLFTKEDAIASVANYLKVNGWTPQREGQQKAVFHYNNSQDYVDCVLGLASKIEQAGPEQRGEQRN